MKLTKKMREAVEAFRIERVKKNKRVTNAVFAADLDVVFFGRPVVREGITYKSLFQLTEADLTPRAKAALVVLAEEHDKAIANFIRARDKAAEAKGGILAKGNGRYGYWPPFEVR